MARMSPARVIQLEAALNRQDRCLRCLEVANLWQPIGLCCDCYKAYILWWTEIRLGPQKTRRKI